MLPVVALFNLEKCDIQIVTSGQMDGQMRENRYL